jgi:hypothetical protein
MLPEDGSCTETCTSKVIVKYIICRILHFVVLIEFVNQFTIHRMNRMKQ